MKLILLGSTGLVGNEVLKLALNDSRVEKVIALGRSDPQVKHDKLISVHVDFNHLSDDKTLWDGDAVICALGTTIKKAGTKEKFQDVDKKYPLEVAKKAFRNGVNCFVLNSAMGANPRSSIFYNRTKGEVEEELRAVGFSSLVLVRPGLIGGERNEFRLGEEIGKKVIKFLTPILPMKWQINPARIIAKTMLEEAIKRQKGVRIITSESLVH